MDTSHFQNIVDRAGLRTSTTETLTGAARTITYTYDGLERLTEADASVGTDYTYSYDLAGNRTDGGRTYNAANQVSGWQYDAAGNLTNDGTRSYTYDALNRLTQQGATSYSYNGDGTLVQAGTTRYTQDLLAPLTQVLNDGSANYRYGLDRLAAQNGVSRTWYSTDALGSVRQTLSNSGAVLSAAQYDPWGTREAGSAAPFGFTGELTDGGLVNLRARWYNPASSIFMSPDPFVGLTSDPSSFHHYQYTGNNPIDRTDPSGFYWWGAGQKLFDKSAQWANNANIHVRIQALMMLTLGAERIHAEYTVPDTLLPVDILDSGSGEMWEIKPWDVQDQAIPTLALRLQGMQIAKTHNRLKGINPVGLPYDWNFYPTSWFPGNNFPKGNIYIGTDDSGYYDLYAAQTQPGVIAWWKYPRLKRIQVPNPIILPNTMAWNKKNIRPGWVPLSASGLPIPVGAIDISIGVLRGFATSCTKLSDPWQPFKDAIEDLGELGNQLRPSPYSSGIPIYTPPIFAP